MANLAQLSAKVDSFLSALQPVRNLINEHALIDASGSTSLADLLGQHCETAGRAKFFGIGSHDFELITIGLRMVVQDFRVAKKNATTKGAYSTVLGGVSDIALGVLGAAERCMHGTAGIRALGADSTEALEVIGFSDGKTTRHWLQDSVQRQAKKLVKPLNAKSLHRPLKIH